MHELSVVSGIVELAEKELRNSGATKIDEIHLEIGKLAGIEFDAFDFAWPHATKNSALEKSIRKITLIEGIARCTECENKFEIRDQFDPCPNCGNYFTDILHGSELRVKSLVVT